MNLVPVGASPLLFVIGVVLVLVGIFWLLMRILNQRAPVYRWGLASVFLMLALLLLRDSFHDGNARDGSRSVAIQSGQLLIRTWGDAVSTPIRQITRVITGTACKSPPRYTRSKGTNGPGLVAGWFNDDRGPVFVDYVSRPNLCIQVAAGPDLALQVQDPDVFLASLKQHGLAAGADIPSGPKP